MYFKQIAEIVEGRKTCTQRVVKPGETAHVDEDGEIRIVFDARGRVKWQVGRDYAVSPGRGQKAVRVFWGDSLRPCPIIVYPSGIERGGMVVDISDEFVPLRIRIQRIERVALHSVDRAVALAEGVASVEAYQALWDTIAGKTGPRWDANPMVWRLWFEVVR